MQLSYRYEDFRLNQYLINKFNNLLVSSQCYMMYRDNTIAPILILMHQTRVKDIVIKRGNQYRLIESIDLDPH